MRKQSKRWLSGILCAVLLLQGLTDGAECARAAEQGAASGCRTASASSEVSYRETVYALDEENKDAQGVYYKISAQGYAMVGDTRFSTAAYTGANDGVVVIPDAVTLDGQTYDVRTIAQYAFYRNSALQEIVIGDNVTKIGDGAFALSGLQTVHIGKQVEDLEAFQYSAFTGTKLAQITVDAENTSYQVQDGVLLSADGSRLIRYPAKDPRTQYTIPDTVTTIAQYAFEQTRNLQDMVIPAGVTEIGCAAFQGSSALFEMQDLRNVTRLGTMAFEETKGLSSVLLGSPLQLLTGGGYTSGQQAFMHSQVEALYFLEGTKAAYSMADNMDALQTAVLDEGVALHTAEFSFCDALETIILPADAKEIPERFAKGCTSLQRVYIPETVETIGDGAFADTNVVLYGKKGSVAETYAQEAGLTFADIDTHTHHYQDTVLYQNTYMEITAMFCETCGSAYDCAQRLLSEPAPSRTPGEVIVTPAPVSERTEEPEQSSMPSASVTAVPQETLTPAPPTGMQTPVPGQSSTPTVSATASAAPSGGSETPEQTASPTETGTLGQKDTPSPAGTKKPGQTVSEEQTSDGESGAVSAQQLKKRIVSGFRVTSKDNYRVTISWKKDAKAQQYRLYRAEKKNGTYTLRKVISAEKTSYTETGQKAGVAYYYKIRACYQQTGKRVNGKLSGAKCSIVSCQKTPVITACKKSAGRIPYIEVRVKKHSADLAQIYVASEGGAYQKIALRTRSIKKLGGVYRLRYTGKSSSYRIRLRTYRTVAGKKTYSYFSNAVTVHVA